MAKSIARMVGEILGDRLESLKIFTDLDDAIDRLLSHPVDIVLLDLNLRGRDGFKLLEQAVSGSFHTIVISANTHRALEAFEHGVLDFIGKPVELERLRTALDRVEGTTADAMRSPRLLAVRARGTVRLIPTRDVEFIQGAGKYSELHLVDETTALHDKNLDKLEGLLQVSFRRIHKSYLVNMAQIISMSVRGGGSYTITLRSGRELPVGRTRYKELRDEIP